MCPVHHQPGDRSGPFLHVFVDGDVTVDRLVGLGYAERVDDSADGRRKVVRLTPRGIESLHRSAEIFDDIRTRWASVLGEDRMRQLEADLRTMMPADGFSLDVAGWFGG